MDLDFDFFDDPSVRRHTAPARPGTGRRRPQLCAPRSLPLETLLPLTGFSTLDINSKKVERKKVRFGESSVIGFKYADLGAGAMEVDDQSQKDNPDGEDKEGISHSYNVKVVNSMPASLMEMKLTCNMLMVADLTSVDIFKGPTAKRVASKSSREDGQSKGPVNSVFEEEEKEEAAQRKKYGKALKDIKPAEGPMNMAVTDKDATRHLLKGHRQVMGSSQGLYYVMSQAPTGEFTACPVKEWYQFEPSLKYMPLTSAEADEEYERRNNVLNYFSVMVKKRLQGVDDDSGIEDKDPQRKTISTLGDEDEWIDSDESEISDGEHLLENIGLEKPKKCSKKKTAKHERKPKVGSGEEDEDDNEFNSQKASGTPYGSCEESLSESEGEEEKKSYQQGVDEEPGLKNLLKWESDSSSDEEGQEAKKEVSEEKPSDDRNVTGRPKSRRSMKQRGREKASKEKLSNSESKKNKSAGGSRPNDKPMEIQEEDPSTSKSLVFKIGKQGTWNIKRVAEEESDGPTPSKQAKIEIPKAVLKRTEEAGITEEAVKRYLLRKPTSVAELCTKFRSKCIQLSKEDLSQAIAHHLQSLNPAKQMLNDKMLLYMPTEADHNSLYLSMREKQSIKAILQSKSQSQ